MINTVLRAEGCHDADEVVVFFVELGICIACHNIAWSAYELL